MPTTPTWAIPYPALSDTPNGPTQMQSLATQVDTLLSTFNTADTNLTARFTNLLVNNAGFDLITTAETRNNATYADLTTVGPTVTLSSVGTKALCIWGCTCWGATAVAAGRMTMSISGATTLAAATTNGFYGVQNDGTGIGATGATARLYTITPGSNTFRAKYANDANGTANFQNRFLIVFAP